MIDVRGFSAASAALALVVCTAQAQPRASLAAGASEPVAPQTAPQTAPRLGTFPVRFAVAAVDGRPVVTNAWLDEQLGWANQIFAPQGVQFERVAIDPLRVRTRLEDRPDRHALAAELATRVINVFVVASLRDVDEPNRMRMGVHWRPEGHPGKHFVIVSASAAPMVLAHELGHFFGNPRHSDVPGNIMSYERGEGLPFFDADQARRIERNAKRFVRTREVVLRRTQSTTSR